MTDVAPPKELPMGRLDALDVGAKKLTIQTEFFPRPTWRIETKVYLGGALKKVYSEDMSATDEEALQRVVNAYHEARMGEIVSGLEKQKSDRQTQNAE